MEVNYDFVYGYGMIPVGGTLDWWFLLTLPSGLTDSYTIKVRYVDDFGNQVGALVSENITLQPCDEAHCVGFAGGENPTPEPSSLILLGSGLLGMASILRRRLKNKSWPCCSTLAKQ